MGRRETRMQGRVMDVYRPGEITQKEAAQKLGLTRAALAMRLHRYRKRNGIHPRRRRPKTRKPAKFIHLSALAVY